MNPYLSPPIPTALPPSGAAGGDLAGTYPNPTVVKLTGAAGVVATTAALALGTTVASAGDIRGTKTFTIKARNAANSPAGSGGDLNVHTIDGANAHTIGGSTNSASITSGVITGGFHAFQVNAVEAARFDSTQLLLTVGGVNFAASVTPVITQAVATSGAGKTALIRAQQGFAGSIGGILQIGGGDGGTPGTNLGGATQVLLGTLNGSSVSAKFSLCTGSAASPTIILDISRSAASVTTLQSDVGSQLQLSGGSSGTALVAGGVQVLLATVGQLRASDVAGVISWTLLPSSSAGASLSWHAGATSVTYSQADNTTNSATAAKTTFRAANATGTTATGGALDVTTGTGTTASGKGRLMSGANSRVQWNDTGICFLGVTTPVAAQVSGGTVGGVIAGLVALGLFAS